MNAVQLTGRLCYDPELKYSSTQTPFCRLRVAVNRNYKNTTTGQRDADFINVTVWRNAAEHVVKWGRKGRLMGFEGRLRVNQRILADGTKVDYVSVEADDVEFYDRIDPKQEDASAIGQWNPPAGADSDDDIFEDE